MDDVVPKKIGILGSGKGSNFDAILKGIQQNIIPAQAVMVISDVEDAGILDIARRHDIPAEFVSSGGYKARLSDESETHCIELLKKAEVEWVVLAGFMRVLKSRFLEAFTDRIVNIHPSLLPSFPGLKAWEQALDYRVKYTGCTVHLVDRGVDTGTILGQKPVIVKDDDDAQSLHQRIQKAEWELYPEILAALLKGDITVKGRLAIRHQS